MFLKKIKSKIKTTGDKSIPPKFGNKFLIGLKNGSVNLFKESTIIYTNLLWMLIILKPIYQLNNAPKIIAHINKLITVSKRMKADCMIYNYI